MDACDSAQLPERNACIQPESADIITCSHRLAPETPGRLADDVRLADHLPIERQRSYLGLNSVTAPGSVGSLVDSGAMISNGVGLSLVAI
jgi:hypothetical protein